MDLPIRRPIIPRKRILLKMVRICSIVLQVLPLIGTLSDHLTPLRQYQKLIDSGVLRGDDHQTRIIQKLQDLHDELLNYDPPMVPYPTSENSIVSLLDPFYPSKLNII